MVSHAIVRSPGRSYNRCISNHPDVASLNLERAKLQHRAYVNTLHEIGLEIIELPTENDLPDACFIEDTVVIYGDTALITRPKYEIRRKEIDSVAKIVGDYLKIAATTSPATLEGGDVIHVEKGLISGKTKRTNEEGISAMRKELGCQVEVIEDSSIVHLKSYVTYLGNGFFIGTKRYSSESVFDDTEYLVIPEKESYAANTLTINGNVLIPEGYPETKQILSKNGFDIIVLDTKEFAKCEGALTCLSIIF